MKEMIGAGHHDDGQLLPTRPVEHVGEQHRLVVLAVDHDRVARHRARIEMLYRYTDQQHAPGSLRLSGEMIRDMRLDRGTERKTCQHRFRYRMKRAELAPRVLERREQVVSLAASFIIGAFAGADATEIRPQCEIPESGQATGKGLDHLVVERPPWSGCGCATSASPRTCPGHRWHIRSAAGPRISSRRVLTPFMRELASEIRRGGRF